MATPNELTFRCEVEETEEPDATVREVTEPARACFRIAETVIARS